MPRVGNLRWPQAARASEGRQMGLCCSRDGPMDDIKVPRLDPNRCGPDVRQGNKNRVAGMGTALGNTNVLQDRMYFEVKVVNPDGARWVAAMRPWGG